MKWQCVVVKAIHGCYIALTYLIVPFFLHEAPWIQRINLINLCLLFLHWKLLNDNCILDLLEKRVCPPDVYDAINNTAFGIDHVTFSNVIQLAFLLAALLAALSVSGVIVPSWIRVFAFCLGWALALYIIPIRRIHKCA